MENAFEAIERPHSQSFFSLLIVLELELVLVIDFNSRMAKAPAESETGNGTIRAKEESLEDAAEVINLALSIPEVREIVYAMPSSVS